MSISMLIWEREREMEVESSETSTVIISNLITSLEQASLMAKHLPTTTTNQSQLHQIHAALQSAHRHLSLFLSHHPPETSISSALGCETGGEPMQMGDDDDDENSRAASVDKVEEKMRDCFIQNKRPKRQLSPSVEQQRRRSYENVAEMGGATAAEFDFDPIVTKLRALDLIYQFHA